MENKVKIYNSLTQKKEELREKRIGMYVCGPTVYDEPHIGHARSAYVFDVIVRYLRYKGIELTFVRNITDIDDKIIDRARREPGDEPLERKVKEVASRYLKRYEEDMDILGLLRPDHEPKATETIDEMITFIGLLIEKGYAYSTDDGSVYFDVRKFKDYGKLSGQSLDNMEEGVRVSLDKAKKDPLDFALWKASKDDEPSWQSPWGAGRPGWHIECSVMSTKFLGNKFLIHGGGLDLKFPHHENEIAQTVCAGRKSAKYWIHNGLLTIDGQKMSKSLGNFISISDFTKNLDLLKMLFLSSHYRHSVDYTAERIEEMAEKRDRVLAFLQKADTLFTAREDDIPKSSSESARFTRAMDDDFNTPLALGVIFKCVADGNKLLERKKITGSDRKKLSGYRGFIRNASGRIFGLNFDYETRDRGIESMVSERELARKNKDYDKADRIREELLNLGVVVEDTKEGPVWRRKL